jgi:threonine synthase
MRHMTFTVTYRNATGALCEECVEATSRTNCLAQMKARGLADNLVICVPSGNFGNICSALFAKAMGLPVKRFIAANNVNDVFYKYLQTGVYTPKHSVQTLANAMDVGDPSNFARILDLYGGSWENIRKDISGAVVNDSAIKKSILECWRDNAYLLDPHGACGFDAVYHRLGRGESALLCETAHPAKFKDTVQRATGEPVEIPGRLAAFMQGTKQSVPMGKDYSELKEYLSNLQ